MHTAIVGAGIAGAMAADELRRAGVRVTLFDKSRGVGGRMAVRRVEPGFMFHHGAQYLTLRRLDPARLGEVLEVWTGRLRGGEPGVRYTCRGGMNALAKWLVGDTPLERECRIDRVTHDGSTWLLTSDQGRPFGGFDALIVALPAPQAAALLPQVAALQRVVMGPTWAMMAGFAQEIDPGYDAAFLQGELAWAMRSSPRSWVVHASPDWSQAHLEDEAGEVAHRLLALWGVGATPVHLAAHRWRYARVITPLGEPCVFDASRRLAICGDWCLEGRVEGAMLSGLAAAERVLSARVGSS